MIRYAVMGLGDNGEWMNIYTDGRTFKSKRTAERHEDMFIRTRDYDTRIDEIKVMTTEEKLEIAVEALSRITGFLHGNEFVPLAMEKTARGALEKIKGERK